MLKFDGVPTRSKLLGHLLWFLFWVTVTAIAFVLTPNPSGHGTHHQLGLPPCAVPTLYGRLCPGCGLTTSFTALMHGDVGGAVKANVFGPILYATFTLTALICAYGYLSRKRWNTDGKWFTWSVVGLVGTYVIFGIWRMATVSMDPQHRSPVPVARDLN